MNLQYIRKNFTGKYEARSDSDYVLSYLQQNSDYTEAECATLANGLMKLQLSINSDNQFELIDNNGKTIRFYINAVHNGFWFTNSIFESIAKYEDDTLIIETTQAPTERRVTYKFQEYYINNNDPSSFRRDIIFAMFNGISKSGMIYEKLE